MKISKLDDYFKGWLVGNFDPSLIKTNDVEFAVKHYHAGDAEEKHYHRIATEITVIISGKVKMNSKEYSAGDVIMMMPKEATDFVALEDSVTAVIKYPGVNDDKYLGEYRGD